MGVVFANPNEVVTAGDEFKFSLTLTKDGSAYNITAGTITATIIADGEAVPVSAALTDHAVNIVTGTAGTCELLLTEAESAALRVPPPNKQHQTRAHALDVKSVVAGVTLHHGPALFEVRRAIT